MTFTVTNFVEPFASDIVAEGSPEDLKAYDCSPYGGTQRVIDATGAFVHSQTDDGMLMCATQEISVTSSCTYMSGNATVMFKAALHVLGKPETITCRAVT